MQSTIPKFSVLMPIYIKENPLYLDQALDSIVKQKLVPDEIVIVEDGPLTQKLYEIIAKYVEVHPSLFTIVELAENRGMGFAIDYGLKICRNEYVARMDTDDIACEDRFLQQMSFLAENPEVDVLGSYVEEFTDNPGDLKRYRKVPVDHFSIVKFLKKRSPVNHMTVVFKKSKALQSGSYWSKRALEDYHLWYQMVKHGCKFYNLPEVLVYARIGNNMLGRRTGKEYFEHELLFFKIMRSDRFINNVEFYTTVAARLVIRLLPVTILGVLYNRFLRQHSK